MNKQDKKILFFSIIFSILFCIAFFGFFIWFGLVGYRYTDYYKAREYDSSNVTTQSLTPQDYYSGYFNGSNVALFASVELRDGSTYTYSGDYYPFQITSLSASGFTLSYLFGVHDLAYNTTRSLVVNNLTIGNLVILDTVYEDSYFNTRTKYYSGYYVSSNFDFSDIVGVQLQTIGDVFGDNNNFGCSSLIYFDSNGGYFQFVVRFYRDTGNTYYRTNFLLDNRIYYLAVVTDNDYYLSGYSAGFEAGDLAGQSTGYSNGFNVGQNVGYQDGYNDGINVSNTYTFSNLLTAVVDAPVHVFISLLDFEIMGFNLLTLVTGLLTFAFIILVIKLILGGK